MQPYLILYYSKTGNSRFLAHRLSVALAEAPVLELKPRWNALGYVFMRSALGLPVGIGLRQQTLADYREILLLGPVWGGVLIGPLRTAIRRCVQAGKPLHLALTCETSDADRSGKYGYDQVLEQARKLGGTYVKTATAFSTSLVSGRTSSWSPKLAEKITFTDANFGVVLQEKLQAFVQQVKAAQA